MRSQTTRTIAGRVNADGTAATGAGFTSRKTGTGAYTVTLTGDVRLIAATSSSYAAGVTLAATLNAADRSFGVTAVVSGALADAPFTFAAEVTA